MRNWLRSTTAHLAATYLAIIMVMSIGFSIVFFRTGAQEIGRQLPPHSMYVDQFEAPDAFDDFFRQRISEGQHDLLIRIILLNILVLIVGGVVSYYLARRTLEPLEEAMEAQARFSSDASHELRTPLTAIRTRNEVALRKQKLSLESAKDVIKSNLDEIIKLEKLSDGLLKLSSSNGKALDKQPVLLGEAANDAMNQFIVAAQAKNIKIEDSVPELKVMGDRTSLTQVLSILLDNAVKYSHEGDTIHLEGRKKGAYALLKVRDSGPGIRATDLPHIFERFYRADHSRTRESDSVSGYGLGLSIAKKIVIQHGGEISASSSLGEGSIFTIKLPLLEP